MTAVVGRLGVLGVFILMVPESAGVPVPSEVTLLFSGFAVHQGWMNFALAVLAATAGNVVGSLIGYAIGGRGSFDAVPFVGAALARWGGLLDRYGTGAVLIARLLPLARTFVSLPAGARGVPLGRFIALTTIGCALWATAFVLAGMIAAGAWSTVNSVLARALLAVGTIVLIASLLAHRRGAR
jgi:membrane protein DedA with SNARE-associated domain